LGNITKYHLYISAKVTQPHRSFLENQNPWERGLGYFERKFYNFQLGSSFLEDSASDF